MSDLSVADRADLTALVHAYAAAVDDRHPAAVADLFCVDGVLAAPGNGRRPADLTVHAGRAAVVHAMEQVTRLHATFHAVVGVVLAPGERDGEATGRVACTAHHLRAPAEDGMSVDDVWHIVYRDRYRRESDGWRIVRRELDLRFTSRDAVRPPTG
jgi:hypothetical protein